MFPFTSKGGPDLTPSTRMISSSIAIHAKMHRIVKKAPSRKRLQIIYFAKPGKVQTQIWSECHSGNLIF